MIFHSRSNYPKVKPAAIGEAYEPIYKKAVAENGATKLVKDGSKPHYQMIQASLEGTKIENIIKAYANGDITALSRRQGLYADITNMPRDLLTAYKTINEAKSVFDTLPLEQRQHYKNSFGEWLAAVDDGSYIKQFAKKKEFPEVHKSEKEGEQK